MKQPRLGVCRCKPRLFLNPPLEVFVPMHAPKRTRRQQCVVCGDAKRLPGSRRWLAPAVSLSSSLPDVEYEETRNNCKKKTGKKTEF